MRRDANDQIKALLKDKEKLVKDEERKAMKDEIQKITRYFREKK